MTPDTITQVHSIHWHLAQRKHPHNRLADRNHHLVLNHIHLNRVFFLLIFTVFFSKQCSFLWNIFCSISLEYFLGNVWPSVAMVGIPAFGTSSTLQPGGFSQPPFGQATPSSLTPSSHAPGHSSHSSGAFAPAPSQSGFPPSTASNAFPSAIDSSSNFPAAPPPPPPQSASGSGFPSAGSPHQKSGE